MVGYGHGGRTAWALGGAYSPPLHHNPSALFQALNDPNGPQMDPESLSVALDVVQAYAILITVGFTCVLFIFLAFCVCANKKDDCYEEFDHGGGVTQVKICHDGGENGLHSFHRLNGSHSPRATDEASEASSRCTLKRELPAIPHGANTEGDGPTECTVERTQSQHSSDLYAAVGEGSEGGAGGKNYGGILVLPTGAIGAGGRAAVIREERSPIIEKDFRRDAERQEASVSATSPTGVSHPYAKVKKNHPYAQVKLPKKEHPYAKVMTKDDSEDPETDTDNYDDPRTIKKEKSWEGSALYETPPAVPEKRFDLEEEDSAGKSGGDQLEANLSATSPHSPLLSTSRSALTTEGTSPTSPHSGGALTTATTTTSAGDRSPSVEIPAAMAMSGNIPANEELPYMTPPLHHVGLPADMSLSGGSAAHQQHQQQQQQQQQQHHQQPQQQQHFSGDSQDSRGYTSISVREPLANIKAQTQAAQATAAAARPQTNVEGEGYYMTVSDDSADEMYACIYEGGRGGGSETYAQIEPRGSSPPAPPSVPSPPPHPSTPSPLTSRGAGSQPPPAPPSVDSLRHVVHSRQASGSSAASVMGSPSAEKRGTRSPLPPLPQGDASLYSAPPAPQPPQTPQSPTRAVNPPAERPTQRALEEMYAKVMKKQRGGHSRDNSGGGTESDTCSQSSSRRGSVDVSSQRFSQYTSTPPSTPRQSLDMSNMTHSLIETRNMEVVIPPPVSRAKSYEASSASWGGNTAIASSTPSASASGQITPQQPIPISNYESISQHSASFYGVGSSDPGYETVKNSEPQYSSVERPEVNYPGYETVKISDVDSEPGYETLKHREYEPGYETVAVEGRRGTQKAPSEPGYETVSNDQRQEYESGYEIVSNPSATRQTTDPGYESVKDKPSSEYDPGYEELHSSGIHHARSTSENDPNYEQLKFTTSRRSSEGDSEPGYETVKKQESESNYECMRDYDTQENYPMYEKIDKNSQRPSQMTFEAVSDIPMYAKVNKGNKSPEKKLSLVKPQQQLDDDRGDGDSAVSPGSIMDSSMETVMARSCSHGGMESSVESKPETESITSPGPEHMNAKSPTVSEKSGKRELEEESPASPPARSPVMQLPSCLLGSPETERHAAASKQPMKPPQHQHSISSDESPTDNSSREASPIVESRPVLGGLQQSSPSKEQQKSPTKASVSPPPPPFVADLPSPTRVPPPINISLDNDDSPPLSPVKQPPSPIFPVKQQQQQQQQQRQASPPPPPIPETVAPPPIPETVAPPPIPETVAPPPIPETVAPPPIPETVAPPPIPETVAPPPIPETVAPPPPVMTSTSPMDTNASSMEKNETTSKSPSERPSSVLDSPERLPSPPPLTDPMRNDESSPVSPLISAVEMPGVATSPSTGKDITDKGPQQIQGQPASSTLNLAQSKDDDDEEEDNEEDDDEDDQDDESRKSMKSESSSDSESSGTTEGEDDDESESEEHLPPPPPVETITENQVLDDQLPPPLPAEPEEISPPVNDIRPCGIPQTPSLTFTDTLGQELNLLDSFETTDPPPASESADPATCRAGAADDQDDLPPPPPPPVLQDEDNMDDSVESGYDHAIPAAPSEFATNGVNVTINPMAEMDDDDVQLDDVLPPPLPPMPVPSVQQPAIVSFTNNSNNNNNNNSGSSNGSVDRPSVSSSADSTTGGSSVESVVTVECCSTGETTTATTTTTTGSAITAPPPPTGVSTTPRQASSESSSPDTPASDPNEQITPV